MIKKDLKANNLSFLRLVLSILTLNPICLIMLYRLSNWLYKKRFKILPNIIRSLNISLFAADISPAAEIGGGLRIAHSVGVVIGPGVIIGENAQIFQNVTLGSDNKTKNGQVMPIIGNNASIYSGSVIVGPIKLGDNVSVGANAVVTKDFRSNVVVAGMPARIVRTLDRTSIATK